MPPNFLSLQLFRKVDKICSSPIYNTLWSGDFSAGYTLSKMTINVKKFTKNFFCSKNYISFFGSKKYGSKVGSIFCAKMTPKGPPETCQSVLTKDQGGYFGLQWVNGGPLGFWSILAVSKRVLSRVLNFVMPPNFLSLQLFRKVHKICSSPIYNTLWSGAFLGGYTPSKMTINFKKF